MILDALIKLAQPAAADKDVIKASQHEDFFDFLRAERTRDHVVLYASAYSRWSIFMHGVLVPERSRLGSWERITEWSGNPADSPGCGLVYGGGRPPRIEWHSNWEDRQPSALAKARQIVFMRSFEARIGDKDYVELAQEITLAHGLHWMEERQSWCRLNNAGDIEDVAGVERRDSPNGNWATVVWIQRAVLDRHMAATGTCLAQMFDSTRVPDNFDGYKDLDPVHQQDPGRTLAYRIVRDGTSSFVRGLQFLLPAGTAEELGQAEYDADRAPKSYETFLIQDFKNDRVVDWSCDPKALASYFVPKSPLPFETSPVFFNAQVLDKYKANREKYKIRDRTITCRNSWYLKTYDVNTAGQVHTYLVYLGHLPYAEQQYWKSFNEAPKAPISARAFKTDFEGSFDTEPDPLRDLIGTLNKLIRKDVPWFRCKASELIEQLHYPLTSAHAGWDDTVLDLAKIIVEGLDKASLRAIANQHQRQTEPTFASIRCLREALQGLGLEESDAIELVSPLVELQAFRTKLSAHAGGREASAMRRDLLRKHGTPKGHVEDLARRLDETLRTAMEVLSPDQI